MSERRKVSPYFFIALAMLLAPFALVVTPTEAAGETFVVTSTADTGGNCTATPNSCTLRQAINSANTVTGNNAITFSFAGSDNVTITPGTVLPQLTDVDTTITGILNPGFQPRIIIDGGGSLHYGISISATADRAIIEKLIFTGFRGTGSAPFGAAIYVNGADTVTVRGSYIGNLPGQPSAAGQPNNFGAYVNGGSGTTIGGLQDTDRNTIAGNVNDGVYITAASGTSLLNNYIGVVSEAASPFRATPRGNGRNGVQVEASADVTVGGSKPNVISANTLSGILITGSTASGNTVSFNYIGTDENGATYSAIDFGNGDDGVRVDGGAQDTVLLGAGAASPTLVISDNAKYGVRVATSATGTQISGAMIGVTRSGDADLGNTLGGVAVLDNSADTSVGPGNVIAGNDGPGVTLMLTSGASTSVAGTRILGNAIGLNAARAAALPNTGIGVDVRDGSSDTLIGNAASPNSFAGYTSAAISIAGSETVSTTVSSNRIGLLESGALSSSTGDGVLVGGGATDTVVTGNTIAGSSGAGVKITGSDVTTATVSLNKIGYVEVSNVPQARPNGAGIIVDGAQAVDVLTNTVRLNTGDGVLVNTGAQDVRVRANTIIGNGGQGVKVDGNTQHVTIRSNRMQANTAGGVQLVGTTIYSGSGADPDTLALPNHGIDPPIAALTGPLRIRMDQNGLISGYVYTDTNTIKDERNILPASACISCTIQFFRSDGTINDGQGFQPLTLTDSGGTEVDWIEADGLGFFSGRLTGVGPNTLPKEVVFAATDGYGNTSELRKLTVTPSFTLNYVDTPDGRRSAAPGDTISYTLSLVNNGTIDFDTMSLITSGTLPRWFVDPPNNTPLPFSLPAGASRPVTVTLALPTGADSSVRVPIADTTTVSALVPGQTPVTKNLVTTVLATPVISSAPLTSAEGSADPGKSVTYSHRFTNSGNVTVTLTLTAQTVDAADSGKIWVTTLDKGQLVIGPGAFGDVTATVTVPLGAQVTNSQGNPVTATTVITARDNAFSIIEEATNTTGVNLVPAVTMIGNGQLEEAAALALVSFPHSVVNTSNGQASFCLNYRSNSGSQVISFTSTNNVPITVVPGEGSCFTLDTVDDPLADRSTILRFTALVRVTDKLLPGSVDDIELYVVSRNTGKEVSLVTDSVRVTAVTSPIPALWLPLMYR